MFTETEAGNCFRITAQVLFNSIVKKENIAHSLLQFC